MKIDELNESERPTRLHNLKKKSALKKILVSIPNSNVKNRFFKGIELKCTEYNFFCCNRYH